MHVYVHANVCTCGSTRERMYSRTSASSFPIRWKAPSQSDVLAYARSTALNVVVSGITLACSMRSSHLAAGSGCMGSNVDSEGEGERGQLKAA